MNQRLIDCTRENLIETAEQVRLATERGLTLELMIRPAGAQISGSISVAGILERRLFHTSAVCPWDDLVARENPLPALLEGVLLALGRRAEEVAKIANPPESRQQG